MARVLAVSSYVASGHVGLAAIVPALHALGHEVIALPTVVLSSHYGYREVGGFDLEPAHMTSLLNGLIANGWLQEMDAVITGYIPTLELADGIARVLDRLGTEHPEVLYLCDPVIGDDPGGIYVPEDVAAAIRDQLVPLADIVTPNRFELQWLSGVDVSDATSADLAAEAIGADLVAATSIPAGAGRIANVLSAEDMAGQAIQLLHRGVPHGTGDLFAALLLGHMLNGMTESEALARASAGVEIMVRASLGLSEMRMVEELQRAVAAQPTPIEPLG